MQLSKFVCGASCLALALCVGCSAPSMNFTQKVKPSKALNPIALKKQNSLDTKFNLAQVREQEGELHKAEEMYRALSEADPKNGDYQHRLGVVLCREGKLDKGLEALRIADSLKPDQPEILNDLGYATLMVGKFELAEQVFAAVLEIDPQNERAINNQGIALGMAGRYDEAFAHFRRVKPEAEALANLGYVAMQTGRRDFALDCYSRALRRDPELRSAAEAMTQLADLDHQIEQRKMIANAGEGGTKDAVQRVGFKQQVPTSKAKR